MAVLKITDFQPFKKYRITIYRKLSTGEYLALETKLNGYGDMYNEVIVKHINESAAINLVEDYILNNRLKPRKLDEEDIL